jgi:hypothetical protein
MSFVEKHWQRGYTCQPREETEVSGYNAHCFQPFSNRVDSHGYIKKFKYPVFIHTLDY